jgi:adenylyltransferase and sulfurtransferase
MHVDGGASFPNPPSMLLFSAYGSPQFRSVRLRSRKPNCAACSAQSRINSDAIQSGLFDYIQFCGTLAPVNELSPSERMSAAQLAKNLHCSEETPIIIDTRDKTQFDLAHIDGSYSIPFSDFSALESSPIIGLLRAAPQRIICTVCRLGNDSQIAAKKLQVIGLSDGGRRWIGDLKGGLRAWRDEVDGDFPDY